MVAPSPPVTGRAEWPPDRADRLIPLTPVDVTLESALESAPAPCAVTVGQ